MSRAGDQGAGAALLESFVTVGTPLPSLATAKGDKGEFKPIWEQEVTDEQGRRRFHGAFTGGFTAGYYGTAGSKEGWAPSNFKSSRGDKSGKKTTAQLAEDLMDDEDLADLQSSRTLSTAAAYAPPTGYDPLLGNFASGPSSASGSQAATAALASLIEPASTRIGAQLMRRMGWRDGQGVGPRLTLQQRRKQAAELGVKLETDDGADDDDSEAARYYYAPLDRPLATVTEIGVASDRGWGLGYKPGPSIPNLNVTKKDSAYGGARMTGDQEDEDDVYGDGAGPSALPSLGSKVGVVDLDEDGDGITLIGDYSRSKQSSARKPPPSSHRVQGTFHDNTRVLSGFVVVRDSLPGHAQAQVPPAAPRGWTPNPSRVWDENSVDPKDPKGKGKQFDATERGQLLGEPAPPPVPKSVFDYMSGRDKERIASFSQGNPQASTSATVSAAAHPVAEPDATLAIPFLDKPTALAALRGFQPYGPSSTSPDSVRQSRYTLYLQLQAGVLPPSSATLPFGPRKLPTGLTQTISELNRELDDYMRAARVFKPVSGLLAGRFTTGGAGGPAPTVEPGLWQPTFEKKDPDASAASLEPQLIEKVTPAQTAVRQGLFGPLTRTVESWHPAKLVCKRFGVRDPWDGVDPNEEESGVGGAWKEASRTGYGRPADRKTSEAVSQSSMDAMMQSAGFRKFQPAEETAPPSTEEEWTAPDSAGVPSKVVAKKEAPTLASVGLGDDEDQGKETLTYTKAPKDIFSAIFADSDDEESDDDEEKEEAENPVVPSAPMVPSAGLAAAGPSAPATSKTSRDVAPAAPLPPTDPDPADTLAATPLSADNLSSYRPTFTRIPKADDAGIDGGDSGSKSKEKKDKKKKAKKAALSFEMDDGEEGSLTIKPKKRRVEESSSSSKKQKKASESKGEEETMDVWVEKEAVVSAAPPRPIIAAVSNPSAAGPKPGRARAADLYD